RRSESCHDDKETMVDGATMPVDRKLRRIVILGIPGCSELAPERAERFSKYATKRARSEPGETARRPLDERIERGAAVALFEEGVEVGAPGVRRESRWPVRDAAIDAIEWWNPTGASGFTRDYPESTGM